MADTRTSDGMSLRDYFAAAALESLVYDCANPQNAAKAAYAYADAMLAARNHPQPTDTNV